MVEFKKLEQLMDVKEAFDMLEMKLNEHWNVDFKEATNLMFNDIKNTYFAGNEKRMKVAWLDYQLNESLNFIQYENEERRIN